MATTVRSTRSAGTAQCVGRRALAGACIEPRGGRLGALCAWSGVLALLCVSGSASAQKVRFEGGVAADATWTSNALIGLDQPKSDTIIGIRPHFGIRLDAPSLQVAGALSLAGVAYANGSRPSSLSPTADLNARFEAVQRFLFLEAALRSTQTSENPFGINSGGATNANRLTTTQTRFSPYIDAYAGPDVRYRLRSDNVRTTASGRTFSQDAPSPSGYFGRHSGSIEHQPRPIGWGLEAERSETRYNDSLQPKVVFELARAKLDYAAGPDLSVGLRAGAERDSLLNGNNRHPVYGLQMKWQPSERTLLTAFEEHRFYGKSWQAAFDHRNPHLAWNMRFSRGIETAPQGLFELPASNNVAALLDAMFTTRIPDPAERARKVQDFIASQGLPTETLRSTNIYSQRLSLTSSGNVTVALIGAQNTLAFSAFYSRSEDAPDAGLLATGRVINNNTQTGGSVVFSRSLSSLTTVSVALDWSRIRALESIAVDQTKQAGASVQANVRLGPKTTLSLGTHYRKLGSNVVVGGHEVAVFGGMNHDF